MSRETLHSLVDIVDEKEIDTVYRILLKFVEEDEAAVDEYAIAVTKGETELLAAIDAVLQELIDDVDAGGNNGIDRLIMKHLHLASN